MKYVISIILFCCTALALHFGILFHFTRSKKYPENRLFSLFCIASAIWSAGFGGLCQQSDPGFAHIWRALGLIGVFLYLFASQAIVCRLSDLESIPCRLFNGFACSGILLYGFIIQKSQVIYRNGTLGMTYCLRPTLWNILYTAYAIIAVVNVINVLLYILYHSRVKRTQSLCRKLLLAECIILLGVILDTLCPLLGIPALPGSSLTQFTGLMLFFNALNFIEHSRINISNMSEFIYYSLAMPVLVYDSDRKLQILNDAAYSFFHISHEQTNIEELEIQQLFNLENEDAFSFEGKQHDIDAICRKNYLYCNLAISELDDSYGDTIGYIVLVTDLSERVNTMQDLEEAIIEAQCANQAKSTFLANMSHEIRTPMNAIIGFSELVLKMDLPPEVREYIQDIKLSSHNLLAIINDILDISKIESGKMELVCADYYTGSLLSDVSVIISSQVRKKGLAFSMNVSPDIPRKLYGDKTRIRGVLVNVLNNAVKYTNAGSVAFDASVKARTEDSVTLEFKVSDTGIGIKEEDLPLLFQSFEQLDQKFHYGVEGSGLGLAIVKGYVNLMGGDISVESVYGEGSVFTIVFDQKIIDANPMEQNFSPDDDPSASSSIGTMKIKNTRVLVVDDNLVNLKVASSSLSYYGLTVDTASGGPAAIELCRQNRYKIVFLDHMMPDMDGVETMKEIRRLDPCYAFGGDSKLIVLTANAVSGVRGNLIQEGFDEYLGKPMNFKQLERLFVRFLPPESIEYHPETESVSAEALNDTQELLYLEEALPEVDTAFGIANCGGQLKDYLNVLEIAWNYGEKQLNELRELQSRQDYENYTIKVHSMKSVTRNLGALDLSEMAKLQEEAGLKKENSYIDAHMEEFQTAYRLLLQKIEAVLRHYNYPEAQTEDAVKESLDADLIHMILSNIRQCIEAFDFTRIFDILEETGKYQMPDTYAEIFSQIGRFMDELNIDEIRSLIDRTLSSPSQ